MKTVMLYPNIRKENIADGLYNITMLLKRLNIEIIAPLWSKSCFNNPEDISFFKTEECVKKSYFIIVLGGDGTILRIARLAAQNKVPIIGINLGHVGFMTELEASEISLLQKIFDREYTIENRIMLDVIVERNNKTVYKSTALNEMTVTNGKILRILKLNITADGIPVSTFRGDGVIIATPTGSTAYSLAAGGPVIEPSAENISVTPICAHEVQAKSYVFSSMREISVTAHTFDNEGAFLSVDGTDILKLLPTDVVTVKRSEQETQLIRVKGESIYNIIKNKLSGGGNI